MFTAVNLPSAGRPQKAALREDWGHQDSNEAVTSFCDWDWREWARNIVAQFEATVVMWDLAYSFPEGMLWTLKPSGRGFSDSVSPQSSFWVIKANAMFGVS